MQVLLRRVVPVTGAILLFISALAAGTEEIVGALRAGKAAAALEMCEAGLKARPADPALWMLKGLALQNLSRTAPALAAFRKSCRLSPRYLPALEAAAQLEYQTRDPECGRTLAKILRLRPAEPAAHAMAGALAYERRDCAAAVSHFSQAGAAVEGNALALWQFGNCLFQQRRPAEAAERFRALLKIRAAAPARYNLGLSLLEAGQPDAAAEALAPLEAGERPESDALSLLAAARQAAKQTPEALKTLRHAVELYPLEERHYIDFATICMANAALEVGMEVLETGVHNIPNSARLHAALGALRVRSGDQGEAEREFARAQELDPGAAYGSVGLGLALLEANRVEESVAVLRRQWESHPSSAMVAVMLAQSLLRQGSEPGQASFEEAHRLLLRAAELDPRTARARGMLGKNYVVLGDTAAAVRELETALRLNPADRTSAYQLMLLYSRGGQKALAEKWGRRTRELLQEEREAGGFRILKAPSQEI